MIENGFVMRLFTSLSMIPAAVLCAAPMKDCFRYGYKGTLVRMVILLAATIPLTALLGETFSLSPNAALMIMLVPLFVIYVFCLGWHISKASAIFAYVCTLMAILSNISNAIDAVFYPEFGADSPSLFGCLVQFGLSILAAALLYYPMSRFGSFLVNNMDIRRVWYIGTIISGIIFVLNLGMVPHRYATLYVNNVFRSLWTLCGSCLALLLLIAFVFYYIVAELLRAAKIEEKSRFLEMQESLYDNQQHILKQTARMRHDLKQTMRTLKGLADERDIDGISAYLDKYTSTMPDNDVVNYCGNSAVNAILNYYFRSASQNGIATDWHIELPDNVGISDIDLCGVIGNILENAVMACIELTDEERYINMSVVPRHDKMLYIVAENSFSGRVRQMNGRYISTHRRGSGIGLSSIISTAESYDGVARFHHEGKRFFSDVMLRMKRR